LSDIPNGVPTVAHRIEHLLLAHHPMPQVFPDFFLRFTNQRPVSGED
jgi:hypothetical protein